jgi:hypothetical protein
MCQGRGEAVNKRRDVIQQVLKCLVEQPHLPQTPFNTGHGMKVAGEGNLGL